MLHTAGFCCEVAQPVSLSSVLESLCIWTNVGCWWRVLPWLSCHPNYVPTHIVFNLLSKKGLVQVFKYFSRLVLKTDEIRRMTHCISASAFPSMEALIFNSVLNWFIFKEIILSFNSCMVHQAAFQWLLKEQIPIYKVAFGNLSTKWKMRNKKASLNKAWCI